MNYLIIKDLYEFFGGYKDYDEFEIIAKDLKEKFKYGSVIFDIGYDEHVYFIAMDNNELVGILKFKVGGSDSFRNPGFCNWICFIEVRSDYRKMGISSKLRDMLFKYCKKHDLNILSSGFTLLGHMYNLKGYIKLAKKYGVEYSYEKGVGHPNFNNFEGMDEEFYRKYYKENTPDFGDYENVIINKK